MAVTREERREATRSGNRLIPLRVTRASARASRGALTGGSSRVARGTRASGSGKVRLLSLCLSFTTFFLIFPSSSAVGPADFECLAVLMEHSQDVKCVTWHPTDELLASASYDDLIKLYAADPYDDEWQCVHTLAGHSATVWSVSFSPCGNYLASAGDDLVIKLWERIAVGADGKDLGVLGEAKPEEGGRMGPWSAGGVRIGVKEKYRWEMRGEIEGAHERTIYSVDWQKGGVPESEGGLGRILTGGGDGRINVFQMVRRPFLPLPFLSLADFPFPSLEQTKPASPSSAPSQTLLHTHEDAHGVSDVNHVAWCTLSPSRAAATLRALEGGDGGEEAEEETEESVKRDEEDPRWKGARDMFASAGDDGLVKVWVVEE